MLLSLNLTKDLVLIVMFNFWFQLIFVLPDLIKFFSNNKKLDV